MAAMKNAEFLIYSTKVDFTFSQNLRQNFFRFLVLFLRYVAAKIGKKTFVLRLLSRQLLLSEGHYWRYLGAIA